jgi:hypothetical protein
MWMETADRIVCQTEIPGGIVSTVFLGLDHQFGSGPPLLFETLVLMDAEEHDCWRTSTWLEAEAQHAAAVEEFQHGWKRNREREG